MTNNSLRELYIDELRDIYSAETQLTKALPKMAVAASSDELRQAFEEHLAQTRQQADRLERVFAMLDEKVSGKKCLGMEGLIKEGSEIMKEDFEEEAMDAALISAAQRVEHYEIAAYGTVCAWADILGESEQASLLRQTLEEEKQADQKLTELSQDINVEATQVEEASLRQAGQRKQPGERKRKRSAA